MPKTILETERTHIVRMDQEHVNVMTGLFETTRSDALKLIEENIDLQQKYGFSVLNVFLKENGQYIGYCGCNEIKLKEHQVIQLTWQLYKKFKEDDIDIEVAFAVRNAMFRNFNIHSLYALIPSSSPQDITVAEAIDMENEGFIFQKQKWYIYAVHRASPKFSASFGDGESPVLSSTLNRNENAPSFVRNLKRPKPRPK